MPCYSFHSKYKEELDKCSNKPPTIHAEALTMSKKGIFKARFIFDKLMLVYIRCTASIYIEEKEALKEHLGNKYSIITEMNCFTLVHEFLGFLSLIAVYLLASLRNTPRGF